ncbi:MAG: antibiotic biosynthesis monooxygenase (ABM) superfamily enzyme [Crocinitomicaceae bacterium]|jgi:antibiotic biosynthesis monooxygenase (ABM) superfamily enzyme
MIKVIIERKVSPGLEANYMAAIKATLKDVLDAPGYISSEPLSDINRPTHKLLITKWASVKAWEDWHKSEQRTSVVSAISLVLDEPEKITLYHAK